MMPRADSLVAADFRDGEVMALVQTEPHHKVLAVSTERSALLREAHLLKRQIEQTRGAPKHLWHIQRGVMRIG